MSELAALGVGIIAVVALGFELPGTPADEDYAPLTQAWREVLGG